MAIINESTVVSQFIATHDSVKPSPVEGFVSAEMAPGCWHVPNPPCPACRVNRAYLQRLAVSNRATVVANMVAELEEEPFDSESDSFFG